MQLATAVSATGLSFTEPVRSLLNQKSPTVWWVSPHETVFLAIQLMSVRQVGALMVLSDGQLTGIVSERDYARKVILQGRNSQSTLVSEIMTTPVLFVTPEQSIQNCMKLMTSRRIRHLPVLEQDKVIGVISIGDIVNWMVSSQQETIQQLHSYINGSYPG